jgi:uncharacterized membrane protein
MPQQQKHAWFNVIVSALIVMTYAVLLQIGGPTVAMAAFTWFALFALGQLFYRRAGDRIVMDERDRMIHAQSVKIAFAVFWLYFVAACLVPWLLYKDAGAVPASLLPGALMIGAVIFILSQSLAMLVQYKRGT